MKKLFGKPAQEKPSQQVSGYGALPEWAKNKFQDLANAADPLLQNAEQYFSPMGLTPGELQAQGMIDPAMFGQNIQQYLNPYRDIVISDINKQFEAPQGALSAQISEAGAFGGTRARGAQGDLERARLDAIASAMGGQYNTAANQMQQGISNLLGFGGLQRGVDLAQRQALPQALSAYSSLINPLLGGSSGTGTYTKNGTDGLVSDVGKVSGLVSSVAGLFSDIRLKTDIKKIGKKNGLNIYEYRYKNMPQKFIGYMAHEVEKLYPHAVGEVGGYKTVNYGVVNG